MIAPTAATELHGGRPRDAERERAILDVACELLVEVGYDQLSLESVATRAHASKATIYRRWSNKAEVVAEALRRRVSEKPAPPDCGSLRADLLGHLGHMCSECDECDGAIVAGVIRAMRASPELAEIVRENIIENADAVPRVVIERAVARAELPSETDNTLVNEVVRSLVFMRMLVSAEALDEAFVLHLVDDIIIPLLRT